MEISDKDRLMLRTLAEDARMPVATLARRLGISRTTAQARLERLEREGVIAGYALRLGERATAGLVRAHVLVRIAPKSLAPVVAAMARVEAVAELHSVSGAFDLIAILAAPSIGELDGRIDEIGAIEGVERTQSSIILSTRIRR